MSFILGLTSPQNQVFLTTKKRTVQGMVPPTSLIGIAPSHLGVLQAVPVTRVRRDTLLALHFRAEQKTTSHNFSEPGLRRKQLLRTFGPT